MNNSRRETLITLSIPGVAPPIASFWLSSHMLTLARAKAEAFAEATVKHRQFAEEVEYIIHYAELTHWQREKWEVNTFFHAREGIAACEITSLRDPEELTPWIRGGGDVNLTGDHGVTLLSWAIFDWNMTALELMFINVADPDVALTATIERLNQSLLFQGATAMLAAIELKDLEFTTTVLPCSDAPDHWDFTTQTRWDAYYDQQPTVLYESTL